MSFSDPKCCPIPGGVSKWVETQIFSGAYIWKMLLVRKDGHNKAALIHQVSMMDRWKLQMLESNKISGSFL